MNKIINNKKSNLERNQLLRALVLRDSVEFAPRRQAAAVAQRPLHVYLFVFLLVGGRRKNKATKVKMMRKEG